MARPCAAKSPYQRRQPEHTVLYRTIAAHLPTFLARTADEDGTGGWPAFVRREFEAYLKCGRLEHGLLRAQCERCGDTTVVAFSCKGRGFCPSCGGRRMSELAAHLVDRVIPHVPVRQWVFTVPVPVRYQLAFDAGLTRAVLRVFLRTVFGWQRERATRRGLVEARSGSVTAIQRFGYRRSYYDLLHEQSLHRPPGSGSRISQRRRQPLEPGGSLLRDLQPPHPPVRLEVVTLPLHQPARDPRPHEGQVHAEPCGRARHRVAAIRVPIR